MALMQPVFAHDTLALTYRLIADDYADCFPKLICYQQLVHRLNRLQRLTEALFTCLASRLPRRRRAPLFPGRFEADSAVQADLPWGAYFGKSSAGWFFGYALHVLTDNRGGILNALLVPAQVDDRPALASLAEMVCGGLVLGDHGYHGWAYGETLYEQTGLLLCCTTDLPKARRRGLSAPRQQDETVFSQLWSRFIDRVRSRSFAGLWQSIKVKLLYHNLTLTGVIQPL